VVLKIIINALVCQGVFGQGRRLCVVMLNSTAKQGWNFQTKEVNRLFSLTLTKPFSIVQTQNWVLSKFL